MAENKTPSPALPAATVLVLRDAESPAKKVSRLCYYVGTRKRPFMVGPGCFLADISIPKITIQMRRTICWLLPGRPRSARLRKKPASTSRQRTCAIFRTGPHRWFVRNVFQPGSLLSKPVMRTFRSMVRKSAPMPGCARTRRWRRGRPVSLSCRRQRLSR